MRRTRRTASLMAKVNAVPDAIAKGNRNTKVAISDLKALIDQFEAQADKKIEPEAAAAITAKGSTVIAALGG